MEDLILRPNESWIRPPGESLVADDQPLRIRFGRVNEGTNALKKIEEQLWETAKRMTGNETAVYRRGGETRLIFVVPETPKPDSFAFEDWSMSTTSRVFKIGKADLGGWLPKDGDTLTYGEKTYTVEKTGTSKTFFQDIGNYEVMMQIFVTEYRGK
jgi:hypothetical protein